MYSAEVSVFVREAEGGPVEVIFQRHEWQIMEKIAEVRFAVPETSVSRRVLCGEYVSL